MSRPRQEDVKRLFLVACELEPAEAKAFLEEACGDDAALRREVESLLAHHLPETILGSAPGGAPPAGERPEATFALSQPVAAAAGGDALTLGRVLAGRYRIVGKLGRGGMGEVYRAEDLKLGQEVALKFLPPERCRDAAWLARYYAEVRLARRVTHPNVTRVYDIVEAEGCVFISMELVDGEDLRGLLQRIGRLPAEKALDVARQLCVGLAAAHDQGVLHRDLKPANIMLDGRGRVRIMDFGIASLAQDGPSGPLAGTPAYMAPELFAGAPPSVRSDLFALGLVLYEAISGKEPYPADADGRRRLEPCAPLTALAPGVNAELDRVVLRCLDLDPAQRPPSVFAVAAALPGGDLVLGALAAGQTPSPSMVAAAAVPGRLAPKTVAACLVAVVAGLALVVALAGRTFLVNRAGVEKPPAVLADRAAEIIARLGYEPAASGRWQGFAVDREFLDHVEAAAEGHSLGELLRAGRPPLVAFWYRDGDARLPPPPPIFDLAAPRLLPPEPGMHTVQLDPRGRLVQFTAIPRRQADAPAAAADPAVAFELAGLRIEEFREVAPRRNPPGYADSVRAWEGSFPESPATAIHVETATLRGRTVSFEIVPDGHGALGASAAAGLSDASSRRATGRYLIYLVALLGSSVAAWRNVRRGRGDLRGAGRLAAFLFALAMLDWLIGERHVAVFNEEATSLFLWTARAVMAGAVAWLCYLAIESYIRRYWPGTMVSWSRVLQGRFRDPLVGRELLFGTLAGIALVLVAQVDVALPSWLGRTEVLPKLPAEGLDWGAVLGLRYKMALVVGVLFRSISAALLLTVLVLVARGLLRNSHAALAAVWLAVTVFLALGADYDTYLPWATGAIVSLALLVMLARLGLVSLVAALFVSALVLSSPITPDLRAWYAPASTFAILAVLTIALYGGWTAVGMRWSGLPPQRG